MKKSILLAIVGVTLFSASSIAQEVGNTVRSDMSDNTRMFIPANSNIATAAQKLSGNGEPLQPEPITITITNSSFTIPNGTVTDANGNVLSEAQITRLQDIIDNNMQVYLGLNIAAVGRLLPSYQSSNFSRYQDFNLPVPLVIPQEAVITAQPVTWSGDGDTARFVFQVFDINSNGSNFPFIVDTGKVNWSSTGWQTSGALRNYTRTLPTGAAKVRFYGQCNRKTGSYCSAVINDAYVIFNPDLPKVGETIIVQSP